LIEECACYDFRYGDLAEAVAAFDELVQDHASRERPVNACSAGF
jgi:hypothetical protein